MNAKFTKEIIAQKLAEKLPGKISHQRMASVSRSVELQQAAEAEAYAKKSAVMLLLFQENDEWKVIFIRRSFYVGIHAGQIAFPGGRYEDFDLDLAHTALREINEEIGIAADKIEILGRLTDMFVPASNFVITIFVGYLSQKPNYKLDEREVADVFEISLANFFDDAIIHEKDFLVPSAQTAVRAPYYQVGGIELWGASAMVMTEFLDILKR
ncbi:MAG: hypothetical protein AUK44_10520 [Porphyromonadaceae bacterium CG2_30_38_12]|nr:MAG: hypothetical protein AUK44_10520 [Porphyromonadaceae bacterium CG2_30_38_12]